MPLTFLDCGQNVHITDIGIKNLPLKHLWCGDAINLYDYIDNDDLENYELTNNFTDEGIKNLPLETLCVSRNKNFTDEGIKNLPLKELWCCGTNTFTYNAIKNLHSLKYLQCCNLLTHEMKDLRKHGVTIDT